MRMNSTEIKSRRPKDNKLFQQDLWAWSPTMTPGKMFPVFFALGLIYTTIGILVLFTLPTVHEHVIDYTDCIQYDELSGGTMPNLCYNVIKNNKPCQCRIKFSLDVTLGETVFMYYSLTNFYQNHRQYASSLDIKQLRGKLTQEPSTACYPLDYATINITEMVPIAPCGYIANSMFNDSFSLHSHRLGAQVPFLRRGIAWPADRQVRFRNPPGDLKEALKGYAKPPAWTKHLYELDLEDPENNGFTNEDFMVWMQVSHYPNFRKLHRIVNHSDIEYGNGLQRGNYTLIIEYNYPVHSFKGTKAVILTSLTILGNRHPFLGVLYIVGGVLWMVMAIVFFAVHALKEPSTEMFVKVDSIPRHVQV